MKVPIRMEDELKRALHKARLILEALGVLNENPRLKRIEHRVPRRQGYDPFIGEILMRKIKRLARRGGLELVRTDGSHDHQMMLKTSRPRRQLSKICAANAIARAQERRSKRSARLWRLRREAPARRTRMPLNHKNRS